jgi:diacylglycerol kinase (ATP)
MGNIKTVLLVLNPISGGMDKTQLIEQVKKEVIKINSNLLVYKTQGENDVEDLDKMIGDIDPCRIICAGGDGTIKLVAEALNSRKIPIGIIPAGSANGLATNLELPTTIEEQIKTALGNSLNPIDIISIENEVCLHMSDFGLNAELIRNYEKSKVRGKLGYLLQSIPTLVESEYPFNFVIEVNNKIIETEGILVAIANARSYGTGATVNPKGLMNDGMFEILIFKNFDVIEILKTLRNEVELDPDFVEIIQTKEARISCTKPVAFQIDGEFLGEKQDVHVMIKPGALLLACPLLN